MLLYYMQEVFSFKKRHTSQLYYDWLCAARCLELVAYCNQVGGAQ